MVPRQIIELLKSYSVNIETLTHYKKFNNDRWLFFNKSNLKGFELTFKNADTYVFKVWSSTQDYVDLALKDAVIFV